MTRLSDPAGHCDRSFERVQALDNDEARNAMGSRRNRESWSMIEVAGDTRVGSYKFVLSRGNGDGRENNGTRKEKHEYRGKELRDWKRKFY